MDEIKALREENMRLREALEEICLSIAHNKFHGRRDDINYIDKTAQQALSNTEEK